MVVIDVAIPDNSLLLALKDVGDGVNEIETPLNKLDPTFVQELEEMAQPQPIEERCGKEWGKIIRTLKKVVCTTKNIT
jgi:hypothetical protein